MSKSHIVGNHMSRQFFFVAVVVFDLVHDVETVFDLCKYLTYRIVSKV